MRARSVIMLQRHLIEIAPGREPSIFFPLFERGANEADATAISHLRLLLDFGRTMRFSECKARQPNGIVRERCNNLTAETDEIIARFDCSGIHRCRRCMRRHSALDRAARDRFQHLRLIGKTAVDRLCR
jgi:hypothetical protein